MVIIGSGGGLAPNRRQATTRTNNDFLIAPIWLTFGEIWTDKLLFSKSPKYV